MKRHFWLKSLAGSVVAIAVSQLSASAQLLLNTFHLPENRQLQKIVLRHGGHIWAESIPKQGTTFCFTIPSRLHS